MSTCLLKRQPIFSFKFKIIPSKILNFSDMYNYDLYFYII